MGNERPKPSIQDKNKPISIRDSKKIDVAIDKSYSIERSIDDKNMKIGEYFDVHALSNDSANDEDEDASGTESEEDVCIICGLGAMSDSESEDEIYYDEDICKTVEDWGMSTCVWCKDDSEFESVGADNSIRERVKTRGLLLLCDQCNSGTHLACAGIKLFSVVVLVECIVTVCYFATSMTNVFSYITLIRTERSSEWKLVLQGML